MKIICVSGLANSGKSTAADMLNYLLNVPKCFKTYFWYNIFGKWPFSNKWRLTAFAKPLKQSLAILLNVPVTNFEDRKFKENYYVDLNTLEIYYKDDVNSDLKLSENKFSKMVKNQSEPISNYYLSIRQLMQYYGTSVIRGYLGDNVWINSVLNDQKSNLIISDLRFIVEFEEVKKRNAIVIYINRASAVPGSHASEREIIDLHERHVFDYEISNNGSKIDLFNNLKELVNNI